MYIQNYCDSEQTFFQKFNLNKKLYIIYALMMFNTFSHTLIKRLNLNVCKIIIKTHSKISLKNCI